MLHVVPSSPTEVPQAPARIMTGLYLRCLREATDTKLEDAAYAVRMSTSAVSRWERAQSPIRADALRTLLLRYGVTGDHMNFLVGTLPPQDYARSKGVEQGEARRAPHDYWADVADDEATARYIAVMRTASELIQFCMVVPAGLRTQAYKRAVLAPEMCAIPDEPVLGLPSWVHRVRWAEEQRRIVLLDETVLTRGSKQSEVVAGQLRHLADLVSRERPDGRGLSVRILSMSPVLFIHTVGPVAEVSLHGHRMVASVGLLPSYETGSRAAQIISAGLREAVDAACSREETHDRLMRAADAMQRRATP
ncbi:Scr1 family TA system antitoxin-like transcriptional regulator [Streptomyces albogriseolus]|uniref:Scr1 family TA system antitoxin-like transcriptional regulator n=1 Tax=Streptomyces TaxID=1883 RepID=UPI003CFAFF54